MNYLSITVNGKGSFQHSIEIFWWKVTLDILLQHNSCFNILLKSSYILTLMGRRVAWGLSFNILLKSSPLYERDTTAKPDKVSIFYWNLPSSFGMPTLWRRAGFNILLKSSFRVTWCQYERYCYYCFNILLKSSVIEGDVNVTTRRSAFNILLKSSLF